MRKLFVSVPMRGRTHEEIKKSMSKMKKIAEAYEGEELELIDSLLAVPEGVKNTPVWCLSKSLEMLSEADVFIGVSDSWNWRGCFIEAEVARRYDFKCYEVQSCDVMDDYWAMTRAESTPVPHDSF